MEHVKAVLDRILEVYIEVFEAIKTAILTLMGALPEEDTNTDAQ